MNIDLKVRLKWSLQALAQPGEIQLDLVPDGANKTSELANDFDHWQRCVKSNFRDELTDEQLQSLDTLDRYLETMSNLEDVSLWAAEALLDREEWQRIRLLAKECLDCFQWPCEGPPRNR